jgi:hypothetical protein
MSSQQQRDAVVDDQKWSSATAFVAAASALDRAIREHGLMSEEARLAQQYADRKLREYKKWRLK